MAKIQTQFFLFLALIISQTYALTKVDADRCTPRCTTHGNCFEDEKIINGTQEHKCICHSLYYGDDCSEKWNDDKTWSILFLIYSIIELVMMVGCAAFCAHQLYLTLRFATLLGWKKWTVATVTLFLFGIGCVLRIVEFAVDPHAVREILPTLADELLFSIPLVLWIAGALSLLLYWVELHLMSGIREVMFVTRLRPVLILLVSTCFLITIPISISNAVIANPVTSALYSAVLAIYLLIFVGISTAFGIKLRKTVRLHSTNRVKGFKRFLLKVTVSVYAMTGFCIATIVTLVMYTVIGSQSERWSYIGLHLLLRLEEAGLICCCGIILRKKVPKKTPTGTTADSKGSNKEIELQVENSTRSESDNRTDDVS